MAEMPRKNRDKLIAAVKAVGKKLYEEAEDIVGETDLITSLEIHTELHPDSGIFFPEIRIERSHIVPIEDPIWFDR